MEQALLSGAAAVLAFYPTRVLGLHEGFWAAITAIAVAQSEFNSASSTGRDQFAGALIGGLVAVAVSFVFGNAIWSYAFAVAFAIVACWIIDVATAARLAGITATIILLVPGLGSPEQVVVSRAGEVAWGAAMAIALVWIANRLADALGLREMG
ncbi:aromatic acid exporter family protein [Sphingomonas sp. BK580]|uniref:FUSC family protein n=1 Tax=Sphingomonas sp. BK580 TaxID=2586972 RepID=UPI00160A89BC|nr:FUSC family protein [Sphingomonas sp. BK580]MBB3695225.1 uncharacterized membrane protein YgaE (UPF0421/DUF939 family) [Sphingomonas sp. BK580]